jgi:hypothetical protein
MASRSDPVGGVGQTLQTAYAIWVSSVPLISLPIWLGLGAAIIGAAIFRKPLANAAARLNGRNRPDHQQLDHPKVLCGGLATFLLHRNYCLHMSGLFAALGADHLGSLVLLGAGACVDALREQFVLRMAGRQSYGPESEHDRAASSREVRLALLRILCAWVICSSAFSLLLAASYLASPDGFGLQALLRLFAHLQTAIIPTSPDDTHPRAAFSLSLQRFRLGLMISSGLVFILGITFFVTWSSTGIFSKTSPKNFLVQSPILTTITFVGSILMLYLFGIRYASSEFFHRHGLDLAFVAWLFVKFLCIGLFSWSYYNILTSRRFSGAQ